MPFIGVQFFTLTLYEGVGHCQRGVSTNGYIMKCQIVILDDEMENISITELVLSNDCPVRKQGIKIISLKTQLKHPVYYNNYYYIHIRNEGGKFEILHLRQIQPNWL